MRHFLGQLSTQALHCTHCILSIVHLPSFLSTAIAAVGQTLAQIPQPIQLFSSIPTAPLVLSCHSLGLTGYMRVAGFLKMLPITVPANLKNPSLAVITELSSKATTITIILIRIPTSHTYLSVQLIQGSIVSTRIGTSARSAPPRALTSAGMLMLVGVLTLILFRNFVPAPLA